MTFLPFVPPERAANCGLAADLPVAPRTTTIAVVSREEAVHKSLRAERASSLTGLAWSLSHQYRTHAIKFRTMAEVSSPKDRVEEE